ncbi:hypothetical protein [Oryzifoliimicrobium ureilyticus]|uniref:hypothetical protein n=1 Tax=Oryzifoliimicrobium ureilyticus TaxID=3113724 RepID=UPI003075F2CF
MPRTGGVYAPPAGTKGTPNTTIQSSKYNALVDDLTADSNLSRPITAGGTGATNATDARANLGADDAGNLTKGTVSDARLPGTMSGKTFSSSITINGSAGINGNIYQSLPGNSARIDNLVSPNNAETRWTGPPASAYRLITNQLGRLYLQFSNDGFISNFNNIFDISANGKIWTSEYQGQGTGMNSDLLRGAYPSQGGVANSIGQRLSDGAFRANYFQTDNGPNSGTIYLGTNGQHYLTYNGSDYYLPNGRFLPGGDIVNEGVGSIYTSLEVQVAQTGSDTYYWHKINNVRRGLTYYSVAEASMNLLVLNSSGQNVRRISLREQDGRFYVEGFVAADGAGYFQNELGVGSARIYSDGNIAFQGPMTGFGNLLSDALNARPPAQAIGANGLGSYAFAYRSAPANMGDLVAGSSLIPSGVAGQQSGATLAGTWRCMGYCVNGSSNSITLWLRVS